jgi:hypothetical protein
MEDVGQHLPHEVSNPRGEYELGDSKASAWPPWPG